ncbi:MAG: hypothetical protein DRH12_18485, partial [Deltaproteobacteria bacterium]
KLVVQYRQQNAGRDFDQEILDDLREQSQKGTSVGATWRVIVNPAEDLPEQKTLALLIFPPSLSWDENGGRKDAVEEYVRKISNQCGGKDRLYRNTLIFLAATSRGLSKLRQAHRERAALEGVKSDYWDQLDEGQKGELKKRLDIAQSSALEALGPAYTVALRVQGQDVEACVLPDARSSFKEHLDYLWTTLVEDEEWILRKVGSVTLEKTGLFPKEGALRLKDAVEAFLRFTDKPIIAKKDAVTSGLAQACADGLVGIGRGGSPSALQARYCKQSVSLDPSEDGVWIIPPFEPEEPKTAIVESITGGATETTTVTSAEVTPLLGTGEGTGTESATVEATAKPTVKRFSVRGAVSVENYGELFRCFVGPAARMNLKKLHLGIQFEMEVPEGQQLDPNDPVLKAMKESARQLGLKFEVEE